MTSFRKNARSFEYRLAKPLKTEIFLEILNFFLFFLFFSLSEIFLLKYIGGITAYASHDMSSIYSFSFLFLFSFRFIFCNFTSPCTKSYGTKNPKLDAPSTKMHHVIQK